MTISIECEASFSWSFDYEETAKKIINAVLDYFECPYEADVSILITDNAGIQEINSSQRDIQAPTDVLSFPMNDFPIAGSFEHLEDDTYEAFNPETGELMLGDIVLSCERIEAQAAEYGHSVEREYGFLITHSMLHLLGYDHMEAEQAVEMEEKQRDILDGIGLKR